MAWTGLSRSINLSRTSIACWRIQVRPSQSHQRISQTFRHASSSSRPSPRSGRALPYGAISLVCLSAVGFAMTDDSKEDSETPVTISSIRNASTLSLLRSYVVWSLLGIPTLVDSSPAILDGLLRSSIPAVPTLAELLVRFTFFAQFIPGETALDCVPAMETLRRRNIGSALNYSAEADTFEKLDLHDIESARLIEIEKAHDVQGALEKRMSSEGWSSGSSAFALKVTGLVDSSVLIRASNTLHRVRAAENTSMEAQVPFPGCPSDKDALVLIPSSSDVSQFDHYKRIVPSMGISDIDPGVQHGDPEKLKILWDRLDSLAERARRNGVRLILDAEESYYEPALDGYVRLLSMKYNRPFTAENHLDTIPSPWTGPVIYGSYQCYLRRQPLFLEASIHHAKQNNYALGLKQVRGGYIMKEKSAWKSSGKSGSDPVWPDKKLTDSCYNESIKTILGTMKRQLDTETPVTYLSAIFGTHNLDSLSEIFNTLEAEGLASRTEGGKLRLNSNVLGRVGIAQLYGMRDDLTDKIQNTFEKSAAPISLIFIAYGKLRETMPFLGRRAIENKSLMSGAGGAAVERRRVGVEIRRLLSLGLLS